MTPTLFGRIQTRIFLILVVGVPWTLLITPLLPARGNPSATDLYPVTFAALAVVLLLGVVVWEPIYHGLQQFRWERDWPTSFALHTCVNEAYVAYHILARVGPDSLVYATKATYVIHIVSTWVIMWLFVIGPIRVIFPRYRFRGGRILGGF